ncbi:MAG TPA: dual specificity protein phosphatase family protein [Pyrinomonadaceae bacterium]
MKESEPTIEVASRYEAGDILSSPQRCAEITYLLSIGDVQDELPIGFENVDRKLRMLVADVVTEFGATEQDISKIITIAHELRSVAGRVLIHCEAGISRSSAAALIMYACWLGPGREREAMSRVLAQRPIAMPNPRMVELADKLLDRNGRLRAVLYDRSW